MKRKGYTEEHTIAILKEREVGGSVPDLTRRHGAADNTIYRRKSNFGAMKGAVMAFSKSLAQSLAPHVRVNCIAPGWIKTSWGDDASDYWQRRAQSESLVDRWGTPEDVARVARFLVSPAASFIAGQIVPVNGGFRRMIDGQD